MQLLIPAALALLSFNIAGPQATKPAPKPLFNAATPQAQTTKPLEDVLSSTSEALKGMKGVYLFVEDLHSTAIAEGLSKDAIHNRVELALRRNGIQVYTIEEMRQAAGQPFLYINVNAQSERANVSVSCCQTVLSTVRPDMQIRGVPVWEQVGIGGVRRVIETVDLYVDKFCLDYLKANPK